MKDAIDFVVLWVDGNDPKWLEEKAKWDPNAQKGSANRYRDWDNLKYWFRAVENFTPWVRKIHLVTWGHLPSFLNVEHPKLNIVKHSDFLPQDVLPIFNSNPIELNIHRIKDLSDKFVLFNDDMFVLQRLSPEFFFRNGSPCDRAIFNALIPNGEDLYFFRSNDMALVNRFFDKRTCVKKRFGKYYSLKYGADLYRNIALYPWGQFTGFYDDHLPIAYNKKVFDEVWLKVGTELSLATTHKFRAKDDLSHWVFRYWQYASGEFTPCKKRGQFVEISDGSIAQTEELIRCKKVPMVCLNDSDPDIDFESLKKRVIDAFECILPQKSSFEV